MRTQYLLIDFENVQPESLPAPSDDVPLKVFLFVGKTQKKISLDLAMAMQEFGDDAAYIRIVQTGKNALDMALSAKIGALAAKDDHAFFHIISKDNDYKALIAQLREERIFARCHSNLDELQLIRRNSSPDANAEELSKWLAARGKHRPGKLTKLRNAAHDHFHSLLNETEINGLIESLRKRGDLSLEGETITYHYPDVPESAALSS